MVGDKHFSFVAPFRVFFAMNFMKFHNIEKMKKHVLQYGVQVYDEKKKETKEKENKKKYTSSELSNVYVYR